MDDRESEELLAGLFGGEAERVEALAALGRRLEARWFDPGDVVMVEGETADWFGVLAVGELEVSQDPGGAGGDERHLASLEPGSLLGELALLRATARSAMVRAKSPVLVLTGGISELEVLLDVPGMHERLLRGAAQRLAAQAEPVPVVTKHGQTFLLRPVLPGDRPEVAAGIDALSDRSRHRRFFSGGEVPDRLIDYLVDLDYENHFAWVAVVGDESRRGVGVARFIRLIEDRHAAELAVAVADDLHRSGVGQALLGALAVAAEVVGIERFTASALAENDSVKRLLARGGASWTFDGGGYVSTVVPVAGYRSFVTAEEADALRLVTAATMSAVAHRLG